MSIAINNIMPEQECTHTRCINLRRNCDAGSDFCELKYARKNPLPTKRSIQVIDLSDSDEEDCEPVAKKPRVWLDLNEDSTDSDDESDSEEEQPAKPTPIVEAPKPTPVLNNSKPRYRLGDPQPKVTMPAYLMRLSEEERQKELDFLYGSHKNEESDNEASDNEESDEEDEFYDQQFLIQNYIKYF
jgi:hypothetical protein